VRILPTFLAGCLLMLAAGCGQKPSASAPEAKPGLIKVRFATDWYPQPEHGGYYNAWVRGYYTAAGLDVDIMPGNPRDSAERRVATGSADMGMSASDGMLIAYERGLPLIGVATTLQHDPQGLMMHVESPVKTFADLEGHSVSVSGGVAWFRYILMKYHLKNVPELPMTFTIANFLHDPNFIQQIFVTSEPYFVHKQGEECRVLPIRDSGYDTYRVMMASRDFLAKNPEIVRKFVAASLRGWADYLVDPSLANAEILRRNPEMKMELMQFSWQALKDGHYIEGFADKGEDVGQFKAERWQNQYEILKQVGVLKTDFDPKAAYTTEFIPKP
jgi:NitT/TauT family transport system substrate-binding protein